MYRTKTYIWSPMLEKSPSGNEHFERHLGKKALEPCLVIKIGYFYNNEGLAKA